MLKKSYSSTKNVAYILYHFFEASAYALRQLLCSIFSLIIELIILIHLSYIFLLCKAVSFLKVSMEKQALFNQYLLHCSQYLNERQHFRNERHEVYVRSLSKSTKFYFQFLHIWHKYSKYGLFLPYTALYMIMLMIQS